MKQHFFWVLLLGILIDFAAVNSGLANQRLYHYVYWLVVAGFCFWNFKGFATWLCFFPGEGRYKRLWCINPHWALYSLVFWLPLFALLEDIGFILLASVVKWQWLYPVDYLWMIRIYGAWVTPLTCNWYFPSSYYIGAVWLILVYLIKEIGKINWKLR